MNRKRHLLLAATLAGLMICSLNCEPISMPGLQPNREARYTIALQRFADPSRHATQAKQYQAEASRITGWDIDVIHEADASVIYWGRYDTLEEAGKDLEEKVRTAAGPSGRPMFPMAMVIPMPGPVPGPPEWDLARIKNPNLYYSVLVAVEYDVPGKTQTSYKKRIVDLVRGLRDNGYDAYYHVVGQKGLVTVGLFPKDAVAVRKQRVKNPKTGKLMMIRDMKVVEDPQMQKLMTEDFPDLAVNGAGEVQIKTDPKTGKKTRTKQKSQPYILPYQQAAGATP